MLRTPSTKCLLLLAMLSVLTACASVPPAARNPLADWQPSPNRNERGAQLIVLHQTEMESAAAALLTLQTRNSGGPVSSHYLIGDDGHLYQLVADSERAWHAGAARWGGISDLNSASIGIELDNDGAEPFSEAQIATLLVLLEDITHRFDIPRHLIIGHGDVAPPRKNDPSVRFPWQRLAEAGFGLWPRESLAPAPAGFDPWAALRLIGYDLRDRPAAVRAFHRHYRGNEDDQWQAGDEELLYDLQQQLIEAPPVP
ncbi:N-acetylmuramoyl-L-alanine amidase [Lysobacter niastensis]|uniref:N-acetylmuramoyl-L-alanine amidase n=1 Tax=Lysobacter niastensis TaxID=380629 RepID=A0ABS0BBB7_9GAMM|nr:N-acetylmuramoyl-L-alanine amidase [Lysobacter niastensis]MBF6025026.1 N-acetylmuramoyl-L-alanine amidase [Lysobacter niastensis]